MASGVDERLTRFGTEPESAEQLDAQAKAALQVLGIHGVSVTAKVTAKPGGTCWRSDIEPYFLVHDTPSRRDPLHRTLELPDPVTEELADLFNRLFGRS